MQSMSKQPTGHSSQAGQGMTEYVIIIGLIAITCIAVAGKLGHAVKYQMSDSVSSFLGDGKTKAKKPELTETAIKERTMKDFARANDKRDNADQD